MIGHARCLPNNDHGTDVMRLHLSVQGLLDTRVTDEDEGTGLEIEVNDTRVVLLLKTLKVALPGCCDGFSHLVEVLGRF